MNFDRTFSRHELLIKPEIEKVLSELNLELYDFDYQQGTSTFRVFIYNKTTKTASLDECVLVDRALSDFFEVADLPDNVRLEVSSPGLYRFLRKIDHFMFSIGGNVKLTLNQTLEGFKGKVITGVLTAVDDDYIEIEETKTKQIFKIEFLNIKSANAEYIF